MELISSILQVYTFISVVFTTIFLIGLIKNIRKALNGDDVENLVEQLKDHIKLVYTERVGDAYYLYDQSTKHFIAQGHTEQEMWQQARLRYPTKDFIIEGENGNAVIVNVKDVK